MSEKRYLPAIIQPKIILLDEGVTVYHVQWKGFRKVGVFGYFDNDGNPLHIAGVDPYDEPECKVCNPHRDD